MTTDIDRDSALRFLWALYRFAPGWSLVELRFRTSAGMGQSFHRARGRQGIAETIVALAGSTDVYVGVIPRRRPEGGAHDVLQRARVLWADLDCPDASEALGAFAPQPGMVTASGTGAHLHAYWFLREPTAVEQVEDLNRRLAAVIGADPRSADRARILRAAGSVNRKHRPPAPVRIVSLRPAAFVQADELERHLPQLPGADRPARGERAGEDPLLEIPPAQYVEKLTGALIGRDRKIRCPFHEDTEPSMHVYRSAERGWYCFGCRRGGSIYDLASLVLGRATRGEDFLALRRELVELFR